MDVKIIFGGLLHMETGFLKRRIHFHNAYVNLQYFVRAQILPFVPQYKMWRVLFTFEYQNEICDLEKLQIN
jgi:hypothetical protein